MDSPVRKMQKRNDYNRHKLLRKIKRRRKAEAEQQEHAAEKELKKRLRVTPPKFDDGKTLVDTDKIRMDQQGLFSDDNGNIIGDSVILPNVDVVHTKYRTSYDPWYPIKNLLYLRNSATNYSIPEHFKETMTGNKRLQDPYTEALFANYMNQDFYTFVPTVAMNDFDYNGPRMIRNYDVSSTIRPAQYRPTKGSAKYKKVMEFVPIQKKLGNTTYYGEEDDSYPVNDQVLYNLLQQQKYHGQTSQQLHNHSLGTYAVSLGRDDRGKYISYYDDYDFNPFSKYSVSKNDGQNKGFWHDVGVKLFGDKDNIEPFGTPFTVYGRRYYTDKDVQDLENRATWRGRILSRKEYESQKKK